MIELPNVTLWAAVFQNTKLLERNLRVLRHCRRHCNFGKTVILCAFDITDEMATRYEMGGVDYVRIPVMDAIGWNIFVNRVTPLLLDDFPFTMAVHEDGFMTNPELWRPEFLDYDYIGAPWHDGVVGNGGFSIESRRLAKAKMMLPFRDSESKIAADMWLCRNSRKALEAQGFTWAPTELSAQFSAETYQNRQPSFGFHGLKWCPHRYKAGWELIEKEESEL